jgi:hypothetical protein
MGDSTTLPTDSYSDSGPFRFAFGHVSAPARRRALAGMFVASAAVSMLLAVVGAPLTVPAAPGGIVTFEFAGSVAEAQRIMAAWGLAGVAAAWTQTWLDFLYLATYGLCLSLASGLAIGPWVRRGAGFGRLGVALSWGALAAAAFDAVENVALLLLLNGAASDAAAGVAWAAAGVKFALILATLVYALLGAALWGFDLLIVRKP